MNSFRSSIIALAVFSALSFAPGMGRGMAAQDAPARSWRLGLWVQTGYQRPSGRFATHTPSNSPELGLLDAVAEFGGSRVFGGGAELDLPDSRFNVRVGWETTVGAEAVGSLLVCDIAEGDLCLEVAAPLNMRGLLVEGRSTDAGPERRFAPVLGLGLGARWYEFSVPDCSAKSGDPRLVCDAITDIYRDSKAHLVLRLGLGLRAHLRGLRAELGGSAGIGRFSGGAGRTEGNWYQDLRINLSVGAVVF